MAEPRPPAVAGRFYPAGEDACRRYADELLRDVHTPASVGAIVPHAGWVFSGSTAALALSGVAAFQPETIVIFGAVHGPDPNPASVYGHGTWDTPLGPLHIDDELAAQLTRGGDIHDYPPAHRREHSIEVQLPLLRRLLPDVKIVPIGVRPGDKAAEIGRFCGAQAAACGRKVAFVGSTDLTHYGPAFGFEPHGRGELAVRWAKEVNDRRLVALIQTMQAEAVFGEAAANRNACGPGAVAATLGAMRELGATRYVELRHTCSAEVEGIEDRDPFNSVGYEAGVFLPA
jgi:MEMO1 family protein